MCQQRTDAVADSSTHDRPHCRTHCRTNCTAYRQANHRADSWRVPMWQLLHARAARTDTVASVRGRKIPTGASAGVRA